MKKNRFLLYLFCTLIFLSFSLLLSCNSEKEEDDLLKYLKNKYGQEFMLHDFSEENDETVIFAYNVSPKNNEEIQFVAGKKKEVNFYPLLPPLQGDVFFDNYFDEAQKHFAEEFVTTDTIVISSQDEIKAHAIELYRSMERVNFALDELGFHTTKYTCSVTVSVMVHDTVRDVELYVLDETTIYSILYKTYVDMTNVAEAE